jgi:hypothetical protein
MGASLTIVLVPGEPPTIRGYGDPAQLAAWLRGDPIARTLVANAVACRRESLAAEDAAWLAHGGSA